MKKIAILGMLFMVAFLNLALADISVTWQVDMTIKTAEGVFTPGVDNVTARGSFMDELGYSGDWFPDEGPFMLADEDQDTIYTMTQVFADSFAGTTFMYKYQINDDVWESCDDHSFVLTAPETIIDAIYFENDEVVTILAVNFLNFRLDLTAFYGSGLGYFDPTTDNIKIEGFWGPGVAEELSADTARYCVENIWQPGIYETQIIIKAEEGIMPEFKAHAGPEDHFENWGWELYDNHTFTVGADSAEIDIEFAPEILPKIVPLSEDISVVFAVDVNDAKNRWNQETVDPAIITHVGLKGQHELMGSWAGTWELSDTTDTSLVMLNDLGLEGDLTAGDNIWSTTLLFEAGTFGGPALYKYSIYYPGADTLPSFDNEMSSGDDNHQIIIEVGGMTVMNDIFNVPSWNGVPVVGVDEIGHSVLPNAAILNQNYPNPFNPMTKMSFSVPQNDFVNITVYNILGQQVKTLVNDYVNTGSYTLTFDGSGYASGIYLVQMTTQSTSASQVRKMMLVK